MRLSAAVHDSGMIKDLYCVFIVPLCCQPFPVLPHTSEQTYAAVHNPTVGAENGKPLSCDGKTECIISICMERCNSRVRARFRRMLPFTKRGDANMISDYLETLYTLDMTNCSYIFVTDNPSIRIVF